jgi:hypothetical protein
MFERFLTRLVCVLFVLVLWLSTANQAKADLYYNTYQGTGAYPTFPGNGGTLTYSTPRSSGTVTRIYHNWGSGAVLNSGFTERVIVNYYGYITIPTAGTYTFYNASDDGFYMKIDGAVVINDWQEQGTQYYNGSGTKTFASAGTYAIDVWYYENGGGAASMLFWNQMVPYRQCPQTITQQWSQLWKIQILTRQHSPTTAVIKPEKTVLTALIPALRTL